MFDELIFERLRVCLGAESKEAKVRQLEGLQETEWGRVADLAKQYEVVPQLYEKLKQMAGSVAVPNAMTERCRGMYLANAARNMRIIHELGLILPALSRAGIPVIALKGAHLAGNVYSDIAVRGVGADVDLLVHGGDLEGACVALRSVGYEPSEEDRAEADWQAKKNITLNGPQGAVPIELHWTIEHPSEAVKVDVEGLWLRAKPARVAGCEVLGFSFEDLLLHLCLEATYHHGNWFRMSLRPLCDIVAIIQCAGAGMGWKEVEMRAREWRAESMVYLALWLAREWLAAPVPEELLGALRPEGFDENLGSVAKELVFFQSLVPATASKMSWNLAQLGGEKPLREKVRISLRATFPSRGQIADNYGVSRQSAWSYFYYVRHTVRLAWKHAPTAWGLLFRRKEAVAGAEGINALIELKERMDSKLMPGRGWVER
jgi:hypothetical protein